MVPCYNEAESIDLAYQRITRELERYGDLEVVFVDDGSTDATLERVRALAAADRRVKYLSFARNFGQEAAFSAGFKYATKPWTVQLDADLQWPPEEVHKLLARTAEGYDVVFGIRERRRDPWFRRFGAAASQWVARAWLGIEYPRGASAFRVVRSSVAKKIVALRLDTPYFIATVPRGGRPLHLGAGRPPAAPARRLQVERAQARRPRPGAAVRLLPAADRAGVPVRGGGAAARPGHRRARPGGPPGRRRDRAGRAGGAGPHHGRGGAGGPVRGPARQGAREGPAVLRQGGEHPHPARGRPVRARAGRGAGGPGGTGP